MLESVFSEKQREKVGRIGESTWAVIMAFAQVATLPISDVLWKYVLWV